MPEAPTYILKAIGGSHAHGLATRDSDEDHVGVYAWPTSAFWNLSQPASSIVHTEPDEAYHEISKFLGLAARSNPTVLEVLWLDRYEETELYWGDRLLKLRRAFASEKHVMNAFLGYAESQFRKMMNAGDENARARSPKHATHMLRLMEQGRALYTTGEMPAKVADPDQYREWATWSTEALSREFERQWGLFVHADCKLPNEPDWAAINHFLRSYRAAHI